MIYDMEALRKKVDQVLDSTVQIRREIHSHPELSGKEVNTEALVLRELKSMGIPCRGGIAGHGVIGTIYGKNREHGVAVRADMDALPLTEQTNVPFKSRIPGVMHACGHDVHTSTLLGTARVLNEIKDILPGSVRLLFQPAEETTGGAKQMIEAGCLEDPHIDSVIGLHVDSTADAGNIFITCGDVNAAECDFDAAVTVKTCHEGDPAEGIDALLPACEMVTSMQSIITRRIRPTNSALITVGKFNSGGKEDITSEKTTFSGTIRTLNMDDQALIKDEIRHMCAAIAEGYAAEFDIHFMGDYPSLKNDDLLLSLVKEASIEILGEDHVEIRNRPSMGSEDFSYFCHNARGLYYNIGVRTPGETEAYAIHSDHFCPDEGCIRTGILTEAASVLKILEKESRAW